MGTENTGKMMSVKMVGILFVLAFFTALVAGTMISNYRVNKVEQDYNEELAQLIDYANEKSSEVSQLVDAYEVLSFELDKYKTAFNASNALMNRSIDVIINLTEQVKIEKAKVSALNSSLSNRTMTYGRSGGSRRIVYVPTPITTIS